MPVYAALLERGGRIQRVWGCYCDPILSGPGGGAAEGGAACGSGGLTELDLLPAGLGDWGPATASEPSSAERPPLTRPPLGVGGGV